MQTNDPYTQWLEAASQVQPAAAPGRLRLALLGAGVVTLFAALALAF